MGKMSETVIALSPMLSRHPAQRARGGGAGGRHKTALARLHSGGSLNRSHAYAAEGGGSFAAPLGHALSAAVALFERAKRDKQQGIDRQFGVSVQPVKQIGMAPPPPVTASQPGLGSNFYDPNAPK